MNVVDSCGWLEYLAGGPNADFFATPLSDVATLVVPTISIYEVFKRVLTQRGEGDALQAVALMQQGSVIDLNVGSAVSAARLSVDLKLPMADAMMLAAARENDATLWTQDAHLDGVDGVQYIGARSGNQALPADVSKRSAIPNP